MAAVLKPCIPLPILLRFSRHRTRPAVKLNDEAHLRAIGIHDEPPDGVLPVELGAEVAVTNPAPYLCLGWGEGMEEVPRALEDCGGGEVAFRFGHLV
jgi:hypothetical protein